MEAGYPGSDDSSDDEFFDPEDEGTPRQAGTQQ
jgi:hypothetical protein